LANTETDETDQGIMAHSTSIVADKTTIERAMAIQKGDEGSYENMAITTANGKEKWSLECS
jgi:hypothetical protein